MNSKPCASLEVVSELWITPEGKAQADSKAQHTRQYVSISRGLQRRPRVSDGVVKPLLIFILVAAVLLAGGCSMLSPGAQPKTRFFMLNSLSASSKPVEPIGTLPQVAIGVGPIRFPEYLDRRDIIVRNSRNEFELAELNQWAEPLGDTFARVLSDNLSILLGSDKVVAFPWRSSIPIDYQVVMQVLQLDGLPGEKVVLRARWQVFSGDGKRLHEYSYSVYEEKVERQTIDALVTAESQAAERLSREIAAALARLVR